MNPGRLHLPTRLDTGCLAFVGIYLGNPHIQARK